MQTRKQEILISVSDESANEVAADSSGLIMLKLNASITVLILLGALLSSLAALIYVVIDPSWIPNPYVQLITATVAGLSGSSFRALWSACERIAHGWETSKGEQWPPGGLKDKFSNRLIGGFLCRPFLGAFVGALIFLGLKSGLLLLAVEGEVRLNSMALAFVSAVAGLFAKRCAESLHIHLPG